jgi:large repetitive protein
MRRFLLPIALLAIPLQTASAQAVQSFPVTSTADAGNGSLRAAIEAANKAPGADTVPVGVTGTIELETALPEIVNSLGIVGPGAANLTIEREAGAPPFRILTFSDPLPSFVRDVTISGGLAPSGAGIFSATESLTLVGVVVAGNEAVAEGGGTALATGGGILSQGALTLRESFVFDNTVTARNGSAKTTASGGGVAALGPLTIDGSTVAANLARALGVGVEDALAVGGGILVMGGPTTIDRSTISYNAALAAAGSDTNVARGGGIGVDASSSESRLTSSTLNGNSAATNPTGALINSAIGSNIQSATASVLRNTIVSFPQGGPASCSGVISSAGFNLDEGHSCGFGQPTDLVDVSPGLNLSLESLGGPTPTHALLETSPAIDRGNSFGEATDQRGLPRPSDFPAISNKEGGDGSDIGAFELQVPPPAPAAPILVRAVHGDRTPPNTRIVSGPARVTFEHQAKFRFASSEGQSRFQCKLDKRRWRGCRNPYMGWVSAGAKHLFKVRAIDRFGNVDPSPARFGWRVKPLS